MKTLMTLSMLLALTIAGTIPGSGAGIQQLDFDIQISVPSDDQSIRVDRNFELRKADESLGLNLTGIVDLSTSRNVQIIDLCLEALGEDCSDF